MATKSKPSPDPRQLRDWALEVIKFIDGLEPGNPVIGTMQHAVEGAFNKGDIRGLTQVRRDLAEWGRLLPGSAPATLDQLLRVRFRGGLEFDASADARDIDAVRKRGRINSDSEYRLLLDRAERIHSNDSRRGELQELNALLARYHDGGHSADRRE